MSKRLIALFTCLVVVVVLIVTTCVVFIVGDVEVDTTSGFSLSSKECNKIISDSNIVRYSNIFGVDEGIAISNVESQNPSVKVISIERKFPNVVCINVTPRTAILSIKLSNNTYALIDRELKVIDVVDEINSGDYITELSGKILDPVQPGVFLVIPWLQDLIKSAEKLAFVNARFSTFIPKIFFTAVSEGADSITLTTNTGVKILLSDDGSVNSFFNYAYTFYLTLSDSAKTTGLISFNGTAFVWSAS